VIFAIIILSVMPAVFEFLRQRKLSASGSRAPSS